MINKFYMESDFLESDCFQDVSNDVGHRMFLERWKKYGVLVFDDLGAKRILSSFNNIPPQYKTMWNAALSHYEKIKVECADVDSIIDFEEIKISNSRFYKTHLVEDCKGLVVCGDFGAKVDSSEEFEVVSARCHGASFFFNKANELSDQDVPSGLRVSEFWNERFYDVSTLYYNPVVVDRYFVLNICRGANSSNSLFNFSKLLVRGGLDYEITIYSEEPDQGEFPDYKDILNERIKNILSNSSLYNIKKIRVNLISSSGRNFSKISHDRYVRFKNFVFQLGVGMKIFELPLTCNCTFSMKEKRLTNSDSIENEFKRIGAVLEFNR